jgi:Holliday junction DNA helicase RuvA
VIGSLTGVLAEKSPPHLLVDVGGVGYAVEAPMSTIFALPPVGDRVRLLTHQVVREDAVLLYGFLTAAERDLFRALLKVSGVGPRIALALLSGISVDGFAQVVQSQEIGVLTKIPGVGRKIAERVLVEMRDRLDALTPSGDSLPVSGKQAEALQALLALDFAPVEAARLIKTVSTGTQSTEELVRLALQSAGRS